MDLNDIAEMRRLMDEFEHDYLKLMNSNIKSSSPRARKSLMYMIKLCKSIRAKCNDHAKKIPIKSRDKKEG